MKHTFIRTALATLLIALSPRVAIAASVEGELRSIANTTQKGLPMMVSDDIQATSITAVGKAMLQRYHFTKKSSSISNVENLKNEFYRNTTNSLCTHPVMSKLISRGAYLTYEYYDIDNRFVLGYSIDQETCKRYQ